MAKVKAFQKFPFSAIAWDFNLIAEPSGGNIRSYFLLRPVKLDVIQDDFGRILCIFEDSANDLKPGIQLRSLKDRAGLELYPGGIWSLATFEPDLNAFGYREGFRSRASLTHETGTG